MFFRAYKEAFKVIAKKPLRLWGLSLLSTLVCVLGIALSFPVLTIVGISFAAVVAAGMSKVYLDALDGKEVNSDQLFAGFRRFWTVLGGLAWEVLWEMIWVFAVGGGIIVVGGAIFLIFYGFKIPMIVSEVIVGVVIFPLYVAGIVLVTNRKYAYRFVPYILMTRDDVSATEALRLSVRLTNGKKLQMFLADIILSAALPTVIMLFFLPTLIPYVGGIFAVLFIAVVVVVSLLLPIFTGLYSAAFYKMPEVGGPDKFSEIAGKLGDAVNKVQVPGAESETVPEDRPEPPAAEQ